MTTLPDPNELKRKTAEAVERGRAVQPQREADEAAVAKVKRAADLAKAEAVLVKVPGACENAAAEGKSEAAVLCLNDRDYSWPDRWGMLTPEQLLDRAAIVWQRLADAGLNPEIRYWHDGLGMYSGFHIVARW